MYSVLAAQQASQRQPLEYFARLPCSAAFVRFLIAIFRRLVRSAMERLYHAPSLCTFVHISETLY